jgi:pyrophosphatase PpaX
MPITTVLLDVDGTLLDSREFIFSAYEHALRRHGFDLPTREVLATWVGLPLDENYRIHGGDELVDALVEAHRSFQKANLHLSVPFPGTVDALETLRRHGVVLGAVTSRSRRTSVDTLERAGLARFFGVMVSAEDATALKPDPAPLRHALAVLGRASGGAAMVGDTVHDIDAGRALGIATIGATYGFGRGIEAHAPDHIIASIAELPDAVFGLP